VAAAVAIAVTVVVVLAALVVSLAIGLSRAFKPKGRDHLQAIPIDAAACPYVAVMHEAANQFQVAYPPLVIAYDVNGNELPWAETKARLAPAGVLLEDSITASVPHFPAQVQWYLTKVRDNIRAGREQLASATDGYDFFNRTYKTYADGKLAFGYAGDLIGHQCPVPLGADSEVPGPRTKHADLPI
jgi:hypothetical protein